ncbi:MAG: type II secretion system protein GspK, partial [Methylococcaceae bacterium]|nr:type II secretion system protein GspK [Methylococcaceae bacterium]
LLDRVLMPAIPSTDERQTLVQAILDWRDSDDYRRLRGAEYKQYEQSGLRYRPNNSLFSSVQQLQWVLGMSDDVYDYLRPLFTVWSKGNKVDRTLASVDVLNGLEGLESHTVIDLYQQRMLTVEEEGSTGQIRRGSDSNTEEQYYTLIAQAKVGNQLSKGIEALVKTNKAGSNIPAVSTVMWQETDPSQSLFAAALEPLVVGYSL